MGSPARRPTNPITRCPEQPHYGYAGTDDGRGADLNSIDANRLTLMTGRGEPAGASPRPLTWRVGVPKEQVYGRPGQWAILTVSRW
jgi:hypothetical protein